MDIAGIERLFFEVLQKYERARTIVITDEETDKHHAHRKLKELNAEIEEYQRQFNELRDM